MRRGRKSWRLRRKSKTRKRRSKDGVPSTSANSYRWIHSTSPYNTGHSPSRRPRSQDTRFLPARCSKYRDFPEILRTYSASRDLRNTQSLERLYYRPTRHQYLKAPVGMLEILIRSSERQ